MKKNCRKQLSLKIVCLILMFLDDDVRYDLPCAMSVIGSKLHLDEAAWRTLLSKRMRLGTLFSTFLLSNQFESDSVSTSVS